MSTLPNLHQQSSELVEISQRDKKKSIQVQELLYSFIFLAKHIHNSKKKLKGSLEKCQNFAPFVKKIHCVVQMKIKIMNRIN